MYWTGHKHNYPSNDAKLGKAQFTNISDSSQGFKMFFQNKIKLLVWRLEVKVAAYHDESSLRANCPASDMTWMSSFIPTSKDPWWALLRNFIFFILPSPLSATACFQTITGNAGNHSQWLSLFKFHLTAPASGRENAKHFLCCIVGPWESIAKDGIHPRRFLLKKALENAKFTSIVRWILAASSAAGGMCTCFVTQYLYLAQHWDHKIVLKRVQTTQITCSFSFPCREHKLCS